ncbi:unnamed protein product [Aphis gossypii]|uniref:Uncharacterized protein n=1 Tax=Aphis gossypii TaxID=80765 RepID=A0A9P0IW99_APHGO|nr:unnamed protein product [Aphis gossypii]
MLNAQEIENIKEMVNILRILEKVTKEISGQRYGTMSLVIPIISCIKDNLSAITPTFRIGIELKKVLTDEVKGRFEFIEQNFLLSISTLLDPRFKNIHFKDAVALSKHLVFIQSSINNMENSTPDIDYSNDSSDSVSDPSQVDLWGYHKELAQKYQKKYIDKSNQENQQNLGHEITMYLSTPVSTLNTDPLMCGKN